MYHRSTVCPLQMGIQFHHLPKKRRQALTPLYALSPTDPQWGQRGDSSSSDKRSWRRSTVQRFQRAFCQEILHLPRIPPSLKSSKCTRCLRDSRNLRCLCSSVSQQIGSPKEVKPYTACGTLEFQRLRRLLWLQRTNLGPNEWDCKEKQKKGWYF